MVHSEATSEQPIIGLIPIHFDVPRNYLPLATFVETANQTRAVIEAFNREVFAGELQFEFYVLPPEEGSFKSWLAVALVAGGAVLHFADGDIGKAFIKSLTSHEPAYWAEQAGAYVRHQIVETVHGSTALQAVAEQPRLRQQFETIIVTESTKSFLQKPGPELNRIGITPQRFRDAFEARNKFYDACLKDTNVRALGFDETEKFPIRRRDFRNLQVALPPKEEHLEEPVTSVAEPWEVEIISLKVTSPNWDREDRRRKWMARDQNGRKWSFRIDDANFWRLVSDQAISPHILDNILVQWAYMGKQRRRARVLKVLEYNGVRIGEPFDDNALRAILGAYEEPRGRGPDLFSR